MNRKIAEIIALGTFALVIVLGAWGRTEAQDAKGPYLKMARPQLMERWASIEPRNAMKKIGIGGGE